MTNPKIQAFHQAIHSHDELIRRRQLDIWVGAEPTFTDRFSEASEWLQTALGTTKEDRARHMLVAFLNPDAGGVILRTLGRQYPKEDQPRWNIGLYQRRDERPIWHAPPDPLLAPDAPPPTGEQLEAFWEILTQRLHQCRWQAHQFTAETVPHLRIAFRRDDHALPTDPEQEPQLIRPSVHNQTIPLEGLCDELAEQGTFLLGVDLSHPDEKPTICIELPACESVAMFLKLLDIVGESARNAELTTLKLCGFPPPVDPSVTWTSLTPDPAVVEVNLAPAPDITTFLDWNQRCFEAATAVELSPYRLHYNGQITDSGGGGQITLGGTEPDQSPFLLYPHLLPALVTFFNRHPALSFLFAGDSVGNSSQAPRPDERTADIFEELELALALLNRQSNPSPEYIWQTLSPFLADPTGNTHRTEINIEKLWNPYLPGRGRLGLVEFRAFRMPRTPERLAALAILLRSIVALLIQKQDESKLIHWGRELHDRFALPFYLHADLWEVLDELARVGLGLGQPLIDELVDETDHQIGETEFAGCRLSVRRSLEFWPLLGDALSQEHGHSRLVDASTNRLEIRLNRVAGEKSAPPLADWQLTVNGYRMPLRYEDDIDGEVRLLGLRYRRFKPWIGLHPTLEATKPIELVLSHPDQPGALRVTLHEWKPQGGSYEGLPKTLEEATDRRVERFGIEQLDYKLEEPPIEPPAAALSPYCLDLRWL